MRACFGGLGAANDLPAAANAFATAFVADIEAALPLKEALLRKQIGKSGLTRIIVKDLDAMHRGIPGPALFPNLRAVSKEVMDQHHRKVKTSGINGGLGQDFGDIASLISAAAGAASKIYSAVSDADMNKQLIKLQQQRNATAIQIAELQAKTAQVQLAAANVAATGVTSSSPLAGPMSTVLEATGGWGGAAAIATGAIALSVAGYLALKR